MIIHNRLDKSFGKVGSFSGVVVFIAGLIMTWSSISGLVLVLIGAFVGFSCSGTFIDVDKKRIRFSNDLFGMIRTGHWMYLDSNMKIGIIKSKTSWRAYSQSNRAIEDNYHDFRIILYDAENKELMPVKKFDSIEAARLELETLGSQLGLDRI
jgi:hypothetical protein